jgi:branched-subunit amino acid ABC-type transport system permease component
MTFGMLGMAVFAGGAVAMSGVVGATTLDHESKLQPRQVMKISLWLGLGTAVLVILAQLMGWF